MSQPISGSYLLSCNAYALQLLACSLYHRYIVVPLYQGNVRICWLYVLLVFLFRFDVKILFVSHSGLECGILAVVQRACVAVLCFMQSPILLSHAILRAHNWPQDLRWREWADLSEVILNQLAQVQAATLFLWLWSLCTLRANLPVWFGWHCRVRPTSAQ